ncbi:MAG: hypothetical protein ACLP7F_23135 [Acidimicrobiales bacterium]
MAVTLRTSAIIAAVIAILALLHAQKWTYGAAAADPLQGGRRARVGIVIEHVTKLTGLGCPQYRTPGGGSAHLPVCAQSGCPLLPALWFVRWEDGRSE